MPTESTAEAADVRWIPRQQIKLRATDAKLDDEWRYVRAEGSEEVLHRDVMVNGVRTPAVIIACSMRKKLARVWYKTGTDIAHAELPVKNLQQVFVKPRTAEEMMEIRDATLESQGL